MQADGSTVVGIFAVLAFVVTVWYVASLWLSMARARAGQWFHIQSAHFELQKTALAHGMKMAELHHKPQMISLQDAVNMVSAEENLAVIQSDELPTAAKQLGYVALKADTYAELKHLVFEVGDTYKARALLAEIEGRPNDSEQAGDS